MAQKPSVKPLVGVVDERFCFTPLTRQEREACESCVSTSTASCIQGMPNHMLTETGEISGFCFKSMGSEKASVIPMSKNCFEMTAIYECVSGRNSHAYISIMNNMAETQTRLRELVAELQSCEKHLNFECMHDWTSSMIVATSAHGAMDCRRRWVSTTASCARTHKTSRSTRCLLSSRATADTRATLSSWSLPKSHGCGRPRCDG